MRKAQWVRGVSLLSMLFLLCAVVNADVKVPGFFTDHMVLQRQMPVPIWGWAEPGEEITVTFGGQTKTVTTDASKKWMVKLDAMEANTTGQELTIKGKNQIVLKDILVGEVWICSGQSNMEWNVGGSFNAKEECANANYPAIRHMKIAHISQLAPLQNVNSNWQVCSPKTVGHFTAVGYFFARKIHQELGVPVGLIGTNWGGTRIEPWLAPEGIRQIPELAKLRAEAVRFDPKTETGKAFLKVHLENHRTWLAESEKRIEAGQSFTNPPALPKPSSSDNYNGMIAPLVPFAIRGALWYQGESNGSEGTIYFHKMQALIQGWRTVWNQGDFPFYYVQLANFTNTPFKPEGGQGYAHLRDAQTKALSLPNTGMAVIIDIGETGNIHPKNKQDVGLRLALWALAKDYGKDVVYSGPLYKSYTVEGGSVRISFDHIGSGLMIGKKTGITPPAEITDGKLVGFAMKGKDGKWAWADAKIDGETVVVNCASITEPAAVQYAFDMNPVGVNLYNKEGLPAGPFRVELK